MNSNKRILIVEDEIIITFVIRKCLERMGYTVLKSATTGLQAIDAVKEHQPDLILMDIKINGEIDGIETMELIRQFSDVPVVYLTGNSEHTTQQRAAKTNMAGFLIKPVEDYDLEFLMEQLFMQTA